MQSYIKTNAKPHWVLDFDVDLDLDATCGPWALVCPLLSYVYELKFQGTLYVSLSQLHHL